MPQNEFKTYDDLTETDFPTMVDSYYRMSDLEIGDQALVDQYYGLSIDQRKIFLVNHPELDPKIFNAHKFNRLSDGVVATQRYVRDEIDGVIYDVQSGLQSQIDDFVYKGEYSPVMTYKRNNIVSWLKCGYVCIKDTQGVEPLYQQSSAYWMLIAVGIEGASGIGLTPKGLWENDVSYNVNDFVSYGNKFYQCLVDNINSEPISTNTKWLCIFEITMIDCGNFTDADISGHNENPFVHGSMFIDGNAYGTMEDDTLQSHQVNPLSHPNLEVDGNTE